jgi:mannose-6-phosphate isomerase-like protein (cupin superfamily)
MEKLLKKLAKLSDQQIEPNILKNTLDSIDFAHLNYLPYLEGVDMQQYGRIFISEAPLRVFINIWPAQYQLTTHQHNHFWGYIAVLKGLMTETSFVFDNEENILSCHPPKSYRKGEVVFEPLNTIHHLQNPSPSKPLVTLHVNYPPVYNYDGVKIFDIKNRKIAELDIRATGISWDYPVDYYKNIQENAFEVVNLW